MEKSHITEMSVVLFDKKVGLGTLGGWLKGKKCGTESNM